MALAECGRAIQILHSMMAVTCATGPESTARPTVPSRANPAAKAPEDMLRKRQSKTLGTGPAENS
jgi:hypothetical protein